MSFMDRLKNLKEKTKTKGKDSFTKLKEKYRRKKNLREIKKFIEDYGRKLGPERTLQEIKLRWMEAWADLETRRKIAEMTRKMDWKKPSEKKPEKKEEKPEEEKKKRVYKPGAGTSAALGLSMLGAVGGFIIRMPLAFIIVCVVTAGFLIVALLVKPKLVLLLPLILVISFVVLYFTGQFEVFLTVPIIADAAEQIEEAKDTIILEGSKVYEMVKCYSKVNPDEVEACLEELEEKAKEEIANPDKEYETLEVNRGDPLSDYDYIKPEEGEDYDLELAFKNKNEETFEIDLIDIKVELDGTPAQEGITSYVLDPQEERSMRFSFPAIVCDSYKFKVNVTSRHTGGGTSEFIMAPNEEVDDWRKDLRSFKPNPIADPGPLNIYAFTYPLGILQTDKSFKMIIKIKSPEVEGTARLTDFYLIQKFKFPYQYFDIQPSCTGGVTVTSVKSEKCPDTPSNCFKFIFNPPLSLSKGDTKEIKCNAIINDHPLSGVYTDLIRIESTYDFIQVWEFPSECKRLDEDEQPTEPIPSCWNRVCEPEKGENEITCPQDCLKCGDGFCDPALGEDPTSCPEDCEPGPEEEV